MIFSKAMLTRKNGLVLIADGKPPQTIALKGVEKLDIEITFDIFITLNFADGRESQKYQVRELDAKWLDMRSQWEVSRNKLRKET